MTAAERVRAAYAAIANAGRPEIWITLRPPGDVLAEAARIDARPAAAALPLAGLVAAVKDNIDVAGLPTTAAAPCYAYEPDRDATAVARLRAVGAIVIGKTFMAPEQVAGGAAVTPSIDVFALGGLAAFAALGRPPFGADTAAAVLYRVLHEPPDLTGCPEPVHGLVLRCLALEPADRPALDEIITGPAGRPAAAQDPGAGPRGGRGDRARAGRGRRRGRAGAAPPGPGRRGGSRAGRHARASPQVPSASPSPSLAPGVDPCVVGTWTGTVGDIQIIIDGQPVPATGTGPTEIDLPDGTQEEVYGSRTVFTATSGGNTWTDVFTGSATPHYEDIGGLVYLSDISAHGSWQLLENGALNNSGPLTIAPQPYRYTCSGNEMREFYPAPATGSQESARKLPPPGQGS